MRRLFGGRFAVEVVFLIAVPIASLAAGWSALGIIVASAIAYGLVLVIETTVVGGRLEGLLQRSRKPRTLTPSVRAAEPPSAEADDEVESYVRPLRRPAPVEETPPEPVAAAPEPEQLPEPEPELEPEPDPDVEAEAEPEEAAEEEDAPAVALYAVADEEPESDDWPVPASDADEDSEEEHEDEQPEARVISLGASGAPRQWNVWELERLSRDNAGLDPALDEERTFLLLYLREFADANGLLPIDFDGLVRESFGELVGV